MQKLKILYIAGVSPYHFANMIYDCMMALENAGHDVDFITLYEFDNQKSNMYNIYSLPLLYKLRKLYQSLPLLVKLRKSLIRRKNIIHEKRKLSKDGYYMEHMVERVSPVPVNLIFNKVDKKYDLIITSVWENIISAETLRALYEHYDVPIIMHAADMYPFTGGCQYPGKCLNYLNECGSCPILGGGKKDDQTHLNYLYKKEVYSRINCALVSNSYMLEEAKKCGLFENVLLKKKIFTVNENVYFPHNIDASRALLGIPKNKKFVLFARYVNPAQNPRKGIKEMVDALILFCKDKNKDELDSMCLMLAGVPCEDMYGKLPITVINLGFLSTEKLINAYSASTAFISPSISDAGPSMVNQSIMCGTPVICFKVGTALDVIEHKKNGYKADLANIQDLANGFEYLWSLNVNEYSTMRENARQIGLERQSLACYANVIFATYVELLNVK